MADIDKKEQKEKKEDTAAQKVRAVYRNAAISPQKVRLVADVVRGMKAAEAVDVLSLMDKKGARLVKKVLASAIANAENNMNEDKEKLVVSGIWADEGLKFRRYRMVSRGRGHGFVRRRSHITIELSTKK